MSHFDKTDFNYEKYRNELKKDKEENKMLRKRILGEIKADREMMAIRSTVNPVAPAMQQPSVLKTNEGSDNAVIQIRNLDGARVRISMKSGNTLAELWTEIGSRMDVNKEEYCLIQPCPRTAYGENQMNSTLISLGLCPTANLVFEKNKALSGETAFKPRDGDDDDVGAPVIGDDNDVQSPRDRQPPPMDIDFDNGVAREEEDDNVVDDDDDDDDEEEGIGMEEGHLDLLNWGAGPGHHLHLWGPGYDMVQRVFDEPDLSYQNRNRNDLAAEAALGRLVAQQQQERPSSNKKSPLLLSSFRSHSLKDLSLYALMNTIVASRPPWNVGDLPASLAEEMISILIKEKLLKPHHLRHFVRCHLNKIILDNYECCTNEILVAVRKHAHVEHISLKNCSLLTDEGVRNLSSLQNLRSLILCGCVHITDNIMPTIIGLSNLAALDLERTSITDTGLKQLCKASPPKLSYLNLRATSITQAVISSIHSLPQIKRLSLEACQLSDVPGIELVTSLTDLNLANTFITTESVLRLQAMTQLRCLNLSNTSEVSSNKALGFLANLKLTQLCLPNRFTLTDKGISFLTNMPLASLDLSHYIYITDESMQHVGKIATLRRLFLTNTKITDVGLGCLKNLKELRELNLDRSLVTDDSASMFQSLPRLADLSLSMTRVTDELITKKNLNSCKFLRKLNLSSTDISISGLLALSLPNLRTLNINETLVDYDSTQSLAGCPLLSRVIWKARKVPTLQEP